MIKDTTRTLLITRISQCQQNEACLFNDATVVSLTLFFSYVWHVEDLYIHTNNVTTIAYRLIKNMWCVHVDTHAHANSILSRRDDDVRIINFGFYTYIQFIDAPTGRIKVQGQYDTYKYRCTDIYLKIHWGWIISLSHEIHLSRLIYVYVRRE